MISGGGVYRGLSFCLPESLMVPPAGQCYQEVLVTHTHFIYKFENEQSYFLVKYIVVVPPFMTRI